MLLSGQTNLFNDNNALYNQYNGITNWQPRIGLAWKVGNNTVVRASYTLSNYLEGTGTNLRLTRNPPWQTGHLTTYSSGAALTFPTTTLDQGFSGFSGSSNCTTTTILTYSADCFASATIFTWDPNNRPAVANQWNVSIQHQFGNSTTLQVAYVGQNNDHLMVPINASQGFLTSSGAVLPSPYLAGNPTLLAEAPTDKLTETNGIQNYNALQVSLQKRLSNGLEFQVNYTWSKCLTDSIGYYGGAGQGGRQLLLLAELVRRAQLLRELLLRCAPDIQWIRHLRYSVRPRAHLRQEHEQSCECDCWRVAGQQSLHLSLWVPIYHWRK